MSNFKMFSGKTINIIIITIIIIIIIITTINKKQSCHSLQMHSLTKTVVEDCDLGSQKLVLSKYFYFILL